MLRAAAVISREHRTPGQPALSHDFTGKKNLEKGLLEIMHHTYIERRAPLFFIYQNFRQEQ